MKALLLITIFSTICLFSKAQNTIAWEAENDVSSSLFGKNYPRIVMDGSGNPMVSWGDGTNLFFSNWNGTDFNTPIQLNPIGITTTGDVWQGPEIDSKGDTVYVVYKETPESSVDSHIWCTSSFDGGLTFNTPVRVDYIGSNMSRFPTVTVDQNGNPIIGFMESTTSYLDPEWVVVKSDDFGQTFSSEVLASGWSDASTEACDCCPGQIISEGNIVSMLHRDNFNNIRDTWAGISTDSGNTFSAGMDVDQLNWLINSCPASGPDGVIIGDTLYSTYMSGANSIRVYYNKSSISSLTGSPAIALDQSVTSLASQNYPRIDHSNNALAFVWKQVSAATQELVIQFTSDITNGINPNQEIVDINSIGHVDVALNDGTIFVVWEDFSSGTVKYKRGAYGPSLSLNDLNKNEISVSPNPASKAWSIQGAEGTAKYSLLDMSGHEILSGDQNIDQGGNISIDNTALSTGVYYLKFTSSNSSEILKLIKQ